MPSPTPFESTAAALRACRLCRDAPLHGPPLPQEPRPIVQGSGTARLCIASQAPGTRAHRSGIPFMDPSGVRLRAWLGLDEAAIAGWMDAETYMGADLAVEPLGALLAGPGRRELLEVLGGDGRDRRAVETDQVDRVARTELPADGSNPGG